MIEHVIKVFTLVCSELRRLTHMKEILQKRVLRFANVFELELNQTRCELIVFSFHYHGHRLSRYRLLGHSCRHDHHCHHHHHHRAVTVHCCHPM